MTIARIAIDAGVSTDFISSSPQRPLTCCPIGQQVETYVRQAGPAGAVSTELLRMFRLRADALKAIADGMPNLEITQEASGGRPRTVYRACERRSYVKFGDVQDGRPEPMAPSVPSAVRDMLALMEAHDGPAETAQETRHGPGRQRR